MKSGKVKGIPWEEVKKRLEKKMMKAKVEPKKVAQTVGARSKRTE
jgi:hypothetical protein